MEESDLFYRLRNTKDHREFFWRSRGGGSVYYSLKGAKLGLKATGKYWGNKKYEIVKYKLQEVEVIS
jgi:hypothetical protein